MFKKNAAVTGFPFAMVNKSDGSAITTGTVSGYYLLDGGTQGSIADTPTHEGNGQWSVDLTADEMNGDVVGLLFTHTDAIPVHFTIKTDTKIVSELNNYDPTSDEVDVGEVKGAAVAGIADFKADVSALATAAALAAAQTDLDNPDQYKADVSALATAASIAALNDPTAAANADAVWDEVQSGHVTAGTFGKYLDTTISSRAASLTGSYDVDLQLYETGTTTPIPTVIVSVKNADQSLLMGVLTTDSLGQASMSRDAGTYKLLCEKSGFTFTSPETLTVTSGSVAQTIFGTEWSAPTAPTVYTCIVYGWVKDVDNTGLSSKTVSAKLAQTPVYYSGVGYSAIQSASDTTDANGYFELTLTRSRYMTTTTGDVGRYKLTIGEAKLIWTIEVPDSANVAFSDCRV